MGWDPSGAQRTRIRVIGVNFSDFFIKGKETYRCSLIQHGIQVIQAQVNQVKMTEKWGEIQGSDNKQG